VKNDSSIRRVALETAFQLAVSYFDKVDSAPVAARGSLDELRAQLRKPLADEGMAPEQVISELARDVENGLHASSAGRFYGWVRGGCTPAALAADWLTSAWDQNAALYAVAPAAAVVEEVVGDWLKETLCLPPDTSFALVTGSQMAHTTCLAAARHALLARCGWDVEKDGLSGAPQVRILSTEQRHGSIERAVRLLGIGRSHIEDLSVDIDGSVRRDDLEAALNRDLSCPTIVVLQAGDINRGTYDHFDTLVPVAHLYSAWVHIDGAFGLWAAASEKHRHLLRGVDEADSWVTDGHKWLNVPYDCGYAFVRDTAAHRESMSYRAAYLTHDADARDAIDWNPDWSRRARGFATYAAIRELGRDGIADLVERCCRYAHTLVTEAGQLTGVEVLWEPVVNQGLIRFLDPSTGATEEDHDRKTEEVIAAIRESGEALFTATTFRGRRAMRVSVCNWCTTEADIARSLAAIRSAVRQVSAASA